MVLCVVLCVVLCCVVCGVVCGAAWHAENASVCRLMETFKQTVLQESLCVDLINKTLTHVCHNGERAHTFLCDLSQTHESDQSSHRCTLSTLKETTAQTGQRRDGDRYNKGRGSGLKRCISRHVGHDETIL